MKELKPVDTGGSADAIHAAAFHKELETDVLARTLWGEARGEGTEGMQAVACVVMNRVRRGGWWGDSVIAVCQKPFQFSCWNQDDPNLPQMRAVTAERDPSFATALRVARRAIYGAIDDITGGADHYHAAGIMPYWARGEKPVAVIGNHIFYALNR